jgi:hypothetical protein
VLMCVILSQSKALHKLHPGGATVGKRTGSSGVRLLSWVSLVFLRPFSVVRSIVDMNELGVTIVSSLTL